MMIDKKISILGASGYVGSRLYPYLIESGFEITCLSRSPQKIKSRIHNKSNKVFKNLKADLNNVDLLASQLKGQDVLIYLIHSMKSAGRKYAEADNLLAKNVSLASKKQELRE